MQNTLLFIFYLLLYSPVFAQNSDLEQSREIRSKSIYHKDSNDLKHKYEYYFDYWSEQEIKSGRYSTWNKKGALIYEAYYLDDILDGLEEHFNEKGQLLSSTEWYLGQKEGKEVYYWQDGVKKLIIPYKAGKKEGLEKRYFKNGKLKSAIAYRSGIKEGPANYFKPDGRLKRSLIYTEGKAQKTPKKTSDKKTTTPANKTHELTI